MNIFVSLLLFLLLPFMLVSQKAKPDTVFCDCNKARPIVLKNNMSIGPTISPIGAGTINEISESIQRSNFVFEREHNSAWYKIIIKTNGNLVLDIIPVDEHDDYDFLIFKSNSNFFCDSFIQLKTKPIRACISRNRKSHKGVTGLKFKSSKELIKEGPGDSFAKELEVKNGETYYLVLDNVHKNGSGHTLKLSFEELVTLKGKLTDEKRNPIKADITITNPLGDTIAETKSNSDGYYKIEAALRRNLNYSVNYYNENSFFETKEISLKSNKDSLLNIKTILPTLKKGGKYNIRNINFYGGSSVYLPSALASIVNLYKLMKKNRDLKILIVGHTNGCLGADDSQKLSENRALAIKTYLEKNSIDPTRVKSEGKNCSEMLYPESGAEWQQSLNRRVEIKVLER